MTISPHKITGVVYIILGLSVPFILLLWQLSGLQASGVSFEEVLERELDEHRILFLIPIMAVVIGIPIFLKMKLVMILSLILLPIFWLGLILSIFGAAITEGMNPVRNAWVLASTLTSLVLFILTIWSLKHFKKD